MSDDRLWICSVEFDDGGNATVTAKWGRSVVTLDVSLYDSDELREAWERVQGVLLRAIRAEAGV